MCICVDSADRLQGNEKGSGLRRYGIMRRKVADNERTYYPSTVEKKTAAAYTAQSTVKRINAQLDQYVELSEF